MNTRIYEGTNQARGDGRRPQCRVGSIYSRRTGRMGSDVQKRCLLPTATAAPGVIQWPESGLTASGTGSNPHETDLNPMDW